MLARRVVAGFDGRVRLAVDDFGVSALAERFGVRGYPALFIDDVLVATPNDFWDWGTGARGRYTPWREAASRDAFVADMTALLARRLATGSLDRDPRLDAVAAAGGGGNDAKLPALTLADLDGATVDLATWRGRVAVVAFWAPWCPPCQDSLPWLLGLPGGHEVEVLALAVQTDEAAVRAALREHAPASGGPASARVALGSADDMDAFGGVMAVPTLMVFAPDGALAAVFHGAPPDLHETVESVLAGLASTVSLDSPADAPPESFSGLAWRLQGEAEVAREGDREVLRLRSGSAVLVGDDFANGRVAFDVRLAGQRSFVGIGLRRDATGQEQVYLRPHQSGRFDAMQYTPVEHGVSAWQLFPEHNAAYDLPFDLWLRVELIVAGPRLAVYLDGAAEPVMTVDRLRRDPRAGGIALWSSVPGGEPVDGYPTSFSKVTITRDDATRHAAAHPVGPDPRTGLVAAWSVSRAMAAPEDPTVLPPVALDGWRVVPADEQGRVNLARWASAPPGQGRDTLLARAVLVADRARVVRMGFGFSDRATVFLRGQPVFMGDNTYRSRSERYLGVMRVDNDVLFLPLEAGPNELTFAVTEAFGGWGVMARLLDREGVTVQPPDPSSAP